MEAAGRSHRPSELHPSICVATAGEEAASILLQEREELLRNLDAIRMPLTKNYLRQKADEEIAQAERDREIREAKEAELKAAQEVADDDAAERLAQLALDLSGGCSHSLLRKEMGQDGAAVNVCVYCEERGLPDRPKKLTAEQRSLKYWEDKRSGNVKVDTFDDGGPYGTLKDMTTQEILAMSAAELMALCPKPKEKS